MVEEDPSCFDYRLPADLSREEKLEAVGWIIAGDERGETYLGAPART